MSHWDSARQITVRWPDEKFPEYPGWTRIDCGCCAGIAWGGCSPVDCDQCRGGGFLWRHDASRALALYPGGPFAGHDSPIKKDLPHSANV
jgi:hypothetical protein